MEELIERKEEEYFQEMDMEYERQRTEAVEAEATYLAAKNVLDEYKRVMDEAKEKIVSLAAKGHEFDLITVVHGKRKGAVDMKELQRKYDIMDSEIDELRKPDVEYDTIRLKKS